MGIVAIRKPSDDENISFEISRLVYAVDMREDGSADIMIEGMVNAGPSSHPFNTFEIILPYNSSSNQNIENLSDKTKTFLDENVKENKYRSSYKIIDKNKGIIEISGIQVKIVSVDLRFEQYSDYSSIFLNFREPLQSGDTKAFRIIYNIANYAIRNKSTMYGYENLIVDMGFYDKTKVEHGVFNFNDISNIVICKRIYIWIAFPSKYELLEATPYQITRQWNDYFLSKDKKDYNKSLISWEFNELKPWLFRNRISIKLRRNFLGIIDLLGIIGFVIGIIFGIHTLLWWGKLI